MSTAVISDPLWYKDAIIYQLHIKSFCDSNGDGIGDFNGLTSKLDYLERLGVTAVWLLPFYPSPLRDDGYDIADYFGVHPSYGTLRDFKEFLREAHRRGLKVITELVLNHTSDQHDWFQRSRHAPTASKWRDYYVWSDTPDKYHDARIIFKDFEKSNWAWDPVAKAYYWHRFYSHQPDLNFDNANVHRAMYRVIDYWLDMGVDGMRLDAVPYLYEREGTCCENVPETYEFLRALRAHIDARYDARMLLAEANQWPEDAAAYFGKGDICHMAFHFPLMPRMFMALHMENWFPIVDIIEQTPRIPDGSQWGLFLRNHDELTLEMVTDEERDYMYRYYAHDPSARINLGIRRRLAPLLRNSRRRMELLNILLFSMPGTPVIYYGDEIGMGDNHYLGDRNGVRTPMQWSTDRNAGFSSANPQRLFLPVIIDPEYHYESVNVETGERNLSSLLWWTKRVIAMRRRHRAFSYGDIEFVRSDNPSVLAFVRKHEDERILVVVNLSRFSQAAELDLRAYAGSIPIDIFSNNRFPRICPNPYVVTMGFHDYFWLVLKEDSVRRETVTAWTVPELTVNGSWTGLLRGEAGRQFESRILPAYLQQCADSQCKPRPIRDVQIQDSIPVNEGMSAQLLLLKVRYVADASDTIFLPLCWTPADSPSSDANRTRVVVRLRGESDGIVYDGVEDDDLHRTFLRMITNRRRLQGARGTVAGVAGKNLSRQFRRLLPARITRLGTGRSSVSFSYDDLFHFKLYRRLAEGVTPNIELTRFLTENDPPQTNVPAFLGCIEYRGNDASVMSIAVMSAYARGRGDGWTRAVESAVSFYEAVLSRHCKESPPLSAALGFGGGEMPIPAVLTKRSGAFIGIARQLGLRAAEMHLALASAPERAEFAPEPFSVLYQRSLYQTMQSSAKVALAGLRKVAPTLPEPEAQIASTIFSAEKEIIRRYAVLLNGKLEIVKTRIHGHFHLGQIIEGRDDFYIKDFEGNPEHPPSERRLKRSPLRDVAAMIDSLQCAGLTALYTRLKTNRKEIAGLGPWAGVWFCHMGAVFLESYERAMNEAGRAQANPEHSTQMLRLFLLERAIGNLSRALRENSAEIGIPLRALLIYLEWTKEYSGARASRFPPDQKGDRP